MIIDKELYNWLEKRWRYDNHNKYKHLFVEWINNITEEQVIGFERQMYNDINHILR